MLANNELISSFLRKRATGGSSVRAVIQLALAAACFGVLGDVAVAQTAGTQVRDDPRRARGAMVTREVDPSLDKSGNADAGRVDEAYQPKGLEVGQFLLLPKIEFGTAYNDNVFASKSDLRGDFLTRITPEAELRSRFSTHQLNFVARAEQTIYQKYDDDNTLELFGAGNGRFDISRDWELYGNASAYRRFEDRGSPDGVGGKKPTKVHGADARAGSKAKLGRYTFEGDVGAERSTYGDAETSTGTLINNSDRDRVKVGARGRASYEMFPGYAAVVEFSGNQTRYDEASDDNGFRRDSQGYRALAGIGIDLTDLVRGDFLVGYLKQDYEDDRFKDPAGLALRAQLNWTPSRMTIIVPSLERVVQETTLIGASSIVHLSANVLIRHELERNIVLTLTAGASQDDFEGTDQRNRTYEGRLRGIWALAPEYYVGAEVGHRYRTSNVDTAGFSQTVVMARLGLRM